MRIFSISLALSLSFCSLLIAQTWSTQKPDPQTSSAPNSKEMKAIFLADQFDRGNNPYARPGDSQPKSLPDKDVRRNDDLRDVRVKEMLSASLIRTGTDYFRAALVLQHSGTPQGLLLAHVLAGVAVAKGNPAALWLSAATLDRYLLTVNEKQVFGTQFKSVLLSNGQSAYSFVQNDIEEGVISDILRSEYCVSPLSAQTKGLPGPPSGTSLNPCPARSSMQRRIRK
jgi:hypothetical protein